MMDFLSRDKIINFLKSIIETQSINPLGYSFAINGEWGCGKSWMLEELENQLKEKSKSEKQYLIFHYNAWENDFYEEPLIAILSVMIDEIEKLCKAEDVVNGINKSLSTTALTIFKTVAISVLNKTLEDKTGLDFRDVIDDFGKIKLSDSDLKELNKQIDESLPLKSGLKKIHSQLKELSSVASVIFVVDELDRCLPEYAIKVLERLHHICYEMPVIQIIAFDKKQLENSICQIFGIKDNCSILVNKYLEKFIKTIIPVDNGKTKEILGILNDFDKNFGIYRDNFFKMDFLSEFYKDFFSDLPIRTQKNIIEKTQLAHKLTIAQGYSMEYFSNAILCLELLEVLRLEYFSSEINYDVNYDKKTNSFYATGYYKSDNMDSSLYAIFINKLKKFTNTNASCVTATDRETIIYIPANNDKQLFLNYFLPHLVYTANDGYTHYVDDINKDKEFLNHFCDTLKIINSQ